MNLNEFLDFVVSDDELGLLKVKPKVAIPTSEEHLIAKFAEISDFVVTHSRQPEDNTANIPEYILSQRLHALRSNKEQRKLLEQYDNNHLLGDLVTPAAAQIAAEMRANYLNNDVPEEQELSSFEDILASDPLGLLHKPDNSIFNIKNVPTERAEAEFVARRKRCKDFDLYKGQLKSVQTDLSNGSRRLFTFKDNHLRPAAYFVMDGLLLFLESIDAEVKEEKFKSGTRTRQDGRTHIIFENGTESNMLYRSLYKQLLQNGKSVSETNDESLAMFEKNLSGITDEDQTSGFIYILKSLSEDPEIRSIENLYKIGYSTTTVEKRIANAEQQATYLMAPVEHIASYQCFNMNTQKFEDLIHKVFGTVCLDIEIVDGAGKVCHPREWFIVPLGAIERAIALISTGAIVDFRYDNQAQSIIELEN